MVPLKLVCKIWHLPCLHEMSHFGVYNLNFYDFFLPITTSFTGFVSLLFFRQKQSDWILEIRS